MEYKLITSSQPHTMQDEINKRTTGFDGWELLTIFAVGDRMVAVLHREAKFE
jgi:uncharacterized protein CbrC (UPF0167 family)